MKNQEIIEKLKRIFEGEIILPNDEHYDQARKLWNGLYDKFPKGIARCRNTDDVVKALNFCRDNNQMFSVKGGGHDYAGKSICDKGLVIDLSLMNKVEVDPENKTAVVQGGATVGQLDEATQKYGLATPTGTVSSIGIGGLTLGGGSGYLSRRFGMTLDNLIEAEIVVADGRILLTSEFENEDLFWAIRGGGGNFGIVTSFKFQLHNVGPEVISFQAYFPYEASREVLQFYREYMKEAPREIQCYTFFLNVPPIEDFPKEYHGKVTCALIACHSGDPEKAKAELQPMEDFGDPFLKFQQKVKYTDLQKSFDAGMPKGLRWYTKAHYLAELNDTTINHLLKLPQPLPGPFTIVYLEPVNGAVQDVDAAATAFPHREAQYSLHIFPGWNEAEKDGENINWAKNFHKSLKSEANGGVYVNLLSHDEQDRVKAAYGENYKKLVLIKNKWDPDNLFYSNHNIPPEG